MGKTAIIAAAALFMTACTTVEVRDRSFDISASSAYDADACAHTLTLTLMKGDPDDIYRMSWTVDGTEQPCLQKHGTPLKQGDEVRFGEGRESVFTLTGLGKGEHSMTIRTTNGAVTESDGITFTIAPDPFRPEARVLTRNIQESVLEVRMAEHDRNETYRMSARIDGTPLMKDSVITVPYFSIRLGTLFPGIRTVSMSISDSFTTWTDTLRFTEPAREKFMDLTLDCKRDEYDRPLDYRLTAHRNALPYSVDVSGDFIIHASVMVCVQAKEGERPIGTEKRRMFREPYNGTLAFDGSTEQLLDVKAARRMVNRYTEPSIVSWDWDEWADRYTPREIVDVPYQISEIVPDIRIRHDRVPGVRIRISNNTGKIRINGLEFTDKQIII